MAAVNWDRVYEVYRWWVDDANGDPGRKREHPYKMGSSEWQLLDQIIDNHGTGFKPAFDYRAAQKSGGSRESLNGYDPSSVGLGGGWDAGQARTNYEVNAGIWDFSGTQTTSGGHGNEQAVGGGGGGSGITQTFGPDGTPLGVGTVGAFFAPSELHGAPAELPPGYTMNETAVQFGTDPNAVYPLSSVEAPGIARPWTEGFDPQLSDDRWKDDPGYVARMEGGGQALEGSALSRGTFLKDDQNGAGVMKDATAWAEGYGGAEYDKIYQRLLGEYGMGYDIYKQNQADVYNKLAGMSGTGQTSAANLARSASAYGASAADYLTQGANASAAGVVGASNARNQFLGTVGNIGTDIALQQARR